MNIITIIGGVLFGMTWLAGLYFILDSLINAFRAIAYRKEDVPLFPHWWESPFFILFRPEQLTDRGLIARHRFFMGIIGYLICWTLAILIAWITGVAH